MTARNRVTRFAWAGVAIAVIAAIGYLVLWPSWIHPVAWQPEPNPGFTGDFSQNTHLAGVERVIAGALGPEDVELGPDGWLYTGLRGGRIVRFHPLRPDTFDVFADTESDPLGLEFDAAGNLIVADSKLGLLEVSPDGVRVLLDRVQDTPISFCDDVAIAADGTIWFTDMYRRPPDDLHMNAWEGVPSGRLIAFERESGEATVRLDGLRFANGVTLGPHDNYVLVTELLGARVMRLWLKGERRGESDVFLGGLPGNPDNVTFDGKNTFWIALVSPRSRPFERWGPHPFLRAVAAKIPGYDPPHPIPAFRTKEFHGWVIGVDTTGVVRANLQGPPGGYGAVTSANAYDGSLYLGSIRMAAVGRIVVPPTPR
jgi:sugar lactone lactonase YvrE